MKALQVRRSAARFGLARIAAGISAASAARVGPLELVSTDAPELPGSGWHRVRPRLTGICGSDLATVEGHASPYFDDWVSFPFVPGHEIVGDTDDGRRVVIEPVLGHEARGFTPPFPGAAPGDGDDYAHLALPPLEPGIQIGFCSSTGGGWATEFVAHQSQLHEITDDVPDERAVLVEPAAGGIHAALMCAGAIERASTAGSQPVVAVLGAGTMGLCAIGGLRTHFPDITIVAAARYAAQRRLAAELGADAVVEPDELTRAVRRTTGGHLIGDHVSSGAHATIDAVGTSASIGSCLRVTRPRGRVVLLGMPAEVTVDLTGLWHRETELVGAYTYGTETMPDGGRRRTFDLAIEMASALRLERLLSAIYPLTEHVRALRHAAEAGPRGAVKIAFDLRVEPRKEQHR
jgi:threonine dehydrogenase-like Zn-dependent dehydrogenase